MTEQALSQKLLLQQDVISGFSYSFCKALLKKLKSLKEENRLSEKITEITKQALYRQIGYLIENTEELINVVEEFLKIFEEKKNILQNILYLLWQEYYAKLPANYYSKRRTLFNRQGAFLIL